MEPSDVFEMKRKSKYQSPLAELLKLLDRYGSVKNRKRRISYKRLSRLGLAAQRRKRRLRDKVRRKGRMAARRIEGLAAVPEAAMRDSRRRGGWKLLVMRMEPGAWYGFGDLVALLPEYSRNSVHAYVYQLMPREGVLERAHAPAEGSEGEVSALVAKARWGCVSNRSYKPTKAGALKFARRAYAYSYLYRLTELGEELGVGWRSGQASSGPVIQ